MGAVSGLLPSLPHTAHLQPHLVAEQLLPEVSPHIHWLEVGLPLETFSPWLRVARPHQAGQHLTAEDTKAQRG